MDLVRYRFNLRRICVIGAGRTGGPLAALIATSHPAIDVFVLDNDTDRIAKWNSRHLPFEEKDLYDYVRIGRDGTTAQRRDGTRVPTRSKNLTFTTDSNLALEFCDLVFLCIPDPLSVVDVSRNIFGRSRRDLIVVNRCTCTPGTTAHLASMIQQQNALPGCQVLSMPEFLRPGFAIEDLLLPDRIIIGHDGTNGDRPGSQVVRGIFYWVREKAIFETSLRGAELAKLGTTAMLAQRLASINSLRSLCRFSDIAPSELAELIGTDRRIGKEYLAPATGFGGLCLSHNVSSLVDYAQITGQPEIGTYWASLSNVSSYLLSDLADRIARHFNGNLDDVGITILGLSYKPWANDARDSPTLELIQYLFNHKAQEVNIFDPELVDPSNFLPAFHGAWDDACQRYPWLFYPVRSGPLEVMLCQKKVVVIMTNHDLFKHPRSDGSKCTPGKQHYPTKAQKQLEVQVKEWAENAIPYEGKTCPDGCQECERERDGYQAVDWPTIASLMLPPKLVFDMGKVVDVHLMQKLGFTVIQS